MFACGSLDAAESVFAWGRGLARATNVILRNDDALISIISGNDNLLRFDYLRHVSGDHADDCVFFRPPFWALAFSEAAEQRPPSRRPNRPSAERE